MNIHKSWTQTFNEEVADGGDGENNTAEAVTEAVEQEQPERPEWLLDKYLTEGKTVGEATEAQAKSYKELQSKFGSFTGSPESYEIAVSNELVEAGFQIDMENPLVKTAMEFAKTSNMSQDGFNGMIELYAQNELANKLAQDEYNKEALNGLSNAQSRIDNITSWANKNLPQEMFNSIGSLMNNADSIVAIEKLVSMTRGAPVNPDQSKPSSSISESTITKMQFELDGNGNRRIQTDPAFKAEYAKLRDEFYGTEDYVQVMG